MKTFSCTFLASVASVAALASFVHAAPITDGQSYQLIEVGALPGKKESIPAAINSAGQITGASTAGSLSEAAFRYNPATGLLAALTANANSALTRGFGINDAGDVVGDSTFGAAAPKVGEPAREAAIFRKGSSAVLGRVNKTDRHGRATDINNAGIVVGFTGPDAEGKASRAFVWSEDAGMFDLGTLGGAFAQALALNDAGYVTGNSELATSGAGSAERHAFLGRAIASGKSKNLIDLGTLGGSFSYGTAISEKNHVVGYSTVNNTDGRVHAFLYDGAKMHDLGALAQDQDKTNQSFALGVNRAGQTVGFAYRPLDQAAQQVGFVYRDGRMQDLNNLIGKAASRYLIYAAHAINDNGQIAATAFDHENNVFRAVLLTPVGLIQTQ